MSSSSTITLSESIKENEKLHEMMERIVIEFINMNADPYYNSSEVINQGGEICTEYLALFPKRLIKERMLLDQKFYSRETVSKHNTPQDCWIIVDQKVYDVTAFISKHPGGAVALWRRAGQDASDLFSSNETHNTKGREMLKTLPCLGGVDF